MPSWTYASVSRPDGFFLRLVEHLCDQKLHDKVSTRVPHQRIALTCRYSVLRLGSAKLPTVMEFITKDTPPRLGNLVLPKEELAKLECIPYRAP